MPPTDDNNQQSKPRDRPHSDGRTDGRTDGQTDGQSDGQVDDLLTLDEAAREFEISRRTLERLRQQGLIPGVRRGRYLYVRRADVQRALTFSDPIPIWRHQLTVSSDVLVEEWMQGWIQLTARVPAPEDARRMQVRWAEEARRLFGSMTVSEYQVRHALEAAEAASPSGDENPLAMFLKAMAGWPEDTVVIDALRQITPLLNPLLMLDHGSPNGDGRTTSG